MGCSPFSGSAMVHRPEYTFLSLGVILSHSTSGTARRHLPTSEHLRYWAAVTSQRSMQKPPSVTLGLGFWLAGPSSSSEPMKNWPAGISTMPSGQLAGGAALGTGAALGVRKLAACVPSGLGASAVGLPLPNK